MITLTLESLDALVQRGRLVPSPVSPLSFLRERVAPAPGRPPTSSSTPEAREAFDIVGQPTAQLMLRVTFPDRPRLLVRMAVRGSRACLVGMDGDSVTLGTPVPVDGVVGAIVDAIGTPGSVDGGADATFSAEELKVLAWLWPGTKRALDATLPRAEAVARLVETKTPPDVAATALDDLAAAGLLETQGADVRVAERCRPWLALAWSDHFLQVESTTGRVLFVGPPGGRALSQTVRNTAEGEEPSTVIRLTALPRDGVQRLVAALLGA
jgi:hypothetical protein